MYPMDYEEFKWALGDTVTVKLLRESFEKYQPLGDDLNRTMMRDFRLYMLVGGMPKAVSTYIETNNMRLVDEEKRDILRLYESDFMKILSPRFLRQTETLFFITHSLMRNPVTILKLIFCLPERTRFAR